MTLYTGKYSHEHPPFQGVSPKTLLLSYAMVEADDCTHVDALVDRADSWMWPVEELDSTEVLVRMYRGYEL